MEASIIFLSEIILTFVKIKIKERNGEDVAYSLNRILDKAQMNIIKNLPNSQELIQFKTFIQVLIQFKTFIEVLIQFKTFIQVLIQFKTFIQELIQF